MLSTFRFVICLCTWTPPLLSVHRFSWTDYHLPWRLISLLRWRRAAVPVVPPDWSGYLIQNRGLPHRHLRLDDQAPPPAEPHQNRTSHHPSQTLHLPQSLNHPGICDVDLLFMNICKGNRRNIWVHENVFPKFGLIVEGAIQYSYQKSNAWFV